MLSCCHALTWGMAPGALGLDLETPAMAGPDPTGRRQSWPHPFLLISRVSCAGTHPGSGAAEMKSKCDLPKDAPYSVG